MANIMRFPGGLSKAFTLSYDDGVYPDRDLIALMKEYGIKGTFNLNSGSFSKEGEVKENLAYSRMTEQEVLQLYSDSDIETAVHTLTHQQLEIIPSSTAVYEIVEDRRNQEKLFGRMVVGMAYPYGTYSDEVIATAKAAGICYARTVESHHNFRVPEDFMRWGATCHHNDSMLNDLTERFVNELPNVWEQPFLFYLWGHSYEFEADCNWHIIKKLFERLSKAEGIWFATNAEIYRYVTEWRRLEYSADNNRVYNGSANIMWLQTPERLVEIKPGETVQLN